MRFDSVHTLPLVERLSLHMQALNINLLRLILLQILKFIILFEPVRQIVLDFFFEKQRTLGKKQVILFKIRDLFILGLLFPDQWFIVRDRTNFLLSYRLILLL